MQIDSAVSSQLSSHVDHRHHFYFPHPRTSPGRTVRVGGGCNSGAPAVAFWHESSPLFAQLNDRIVPQPAASGWRRGGSLLARYRGPTIISRVYGVSVYKKAARPRELTFYCRFMATVILQRFPKLDTKAAQEKTLLETRI